MPSIAWMGGSAVVDKAAVTVHFAATHEPMAAPGGKAPSSDVVASSGEASGVIDASSGTLPPVPPDPVAPPLPDAPPAPDAPLLAPAAPVLDVVLELVVLDEVDVLEVVDVEVPPAPA